MAADHIQGQAWQTTFYMVAVIIPLILNWWASRHDFKSHVHPFGVSAMIVSFWIANRFMGIYFHFPESRVLNPIFEFIGGGVCVAIWVAYRDMWARRMAGVFLLLAVIHAAFLPAWYVDRWFFHPSDAMRFTYTLCANMGLLLLLAVGASPGGGYAFRRLRDRMRDSSWSHHHSSGVA